MSSPNRCEKIDDWREVPQLCALRRLVTALTVVLIVGMLAVAAALVIQISTAGATAPAPLSAVKAERVALPPGETVIAVGAGAEALSIATRDAEGAERLRLFHPDTGAEIGMVGIARE